MKANIEHTDKKRIVIVGGGLGGLELAFKLVDDDYQVVLIDKNNYHQFPPLIYQVASGGLEPSSISFPFRRLFQGKKDFFFRMAKVESVNTDKKIINTTVGEIDYDYLVMAFGAKTNFFGNKDIEATTLPMKSVSEAMRLRNTILRNLELALTEEDPARKQALMNIVVVGGGASGVEIAGAVAEMKKNIIARDYPDLDSSQMHIYLVNAVDRLLSAMDPVSSKRAERDLKELHVHIRQPQFATEYKDGILKTSAGLEIPTQTVIWVSGICANTVEGFPAESIGHAGRFLTDRFCRVKGVKDVYAIGDVSLVEGDEEYPLGHPQLAQVAMQQAKTVAKNFKAMSKGKELKPFKYKNLGVMATIGRNHAVAEISGKKFGGFPAWALWLVVHLRSILGVKNKTFILLNWVWNYINYKQSLRLILKAK
ncbi:MAG: NAD(P)/FAD-dependent oxidoreductase [Prevotella sp.]|jgi:pyridine nucleotide-disulfide oxidoreductase|uniref:NAD(P)/FAD-dependent oxidoreductase n=1 Tax=Prevotella TaxID=838 RepID=UPI00045011EC|nr:MULTISPECIES: NAD(P)/FAD-dependent oxidoreductase [Prevotella]ETT02333.1 pyridine nucleotide-disulfide oxidoreductase [Prevotella sp. ICM33]MBF1429826.1 NAD(P)/FAD-dependent oxidoreductase [Prevotella melaninogenica]MBF1607464.1 NAD(P)/FAD-dependent oxidoreductase [Prevotella sp.]MBF1614447.1 NAD(P)/FAD-dependent oxidoreductase [Prevotella sp.]MBF1615722.1 NAD(P)/FAD-dependent oxidoreductase [Prevotella sp.]